MSIFGSHDLFIQASQIKEWWKPLITACVTTTSPSEITLWYTFTIHHSLGCISSISLMHRATTSPSEITLWYTFTIHHSLGCISSISLMHRPHGSRVSNVCEHTIITGTCLFNCIQIYPSISEQTYIVQPLPIMPCSLRPLIISHTHSELMKCCHHAMLSQATDYQSHPQWTYEVLPSCHALSGHWLSVTPTVNLWRQCNSYPSQSSTCLVSSPQ